MPVRAKNAIIIAIGLIGGISTASLAVDAYHHNTLAALKDVTPICLSAVGIIMTPGCMRDHARREAEKTKTPAP